MPLPGHFLDDTGTPASARATYHDRLRRLTSEHGVPLVDFRDHDGDRWFLTDWGGHLSPKGWIEYDRALDDFHRASGDVPR
jgi:D-alanine transfer protein